MGISGLGLSLAWDYLIGDAEAGTPNQKAASAYKQGDLVKDVFGTCGGKNGSPCDSDTYKVKSVNSNGTLTVEWTKTVGKNERTVTSEKTVTPDEITITYPDTARGNSAR